MENNYLQELLRNLNVWEMYGKMLIITNVCFTFRKFISICWIYIELIDAGNVKSQRPEGINARWIYHDIKCDFKAVHQPVK